MMPWMDTGSTDGTVIDSGLPEKLEKEGPRGPVGSRELGKVVCSTGNLSQQKLTKDSVLASTILGPCVLGN